MNTAETADRRANAKTELLERLHNPVQLRICVIVVVMLTGYGAVYMPLSARIAATSQKLDQDTKLLVLADRLEHLQDQYRAFQNRLPQHSDTKEWMHYVTEGVRDFPVKVSKVNCEKPKQCGPYKVIVLRIDLEGSFTDIDKFLRWLESNHRLFRVEDLKLKPGHEDDILSTQLTVVGLTG